MSNIHFMDYENASTVLGAYATEINRTKPITITYAAYQLLSETDKNTHRYIITDYPSPGVGGEMTLGELADVNISGVTDGQVLGYDITSGEWVAIDVATSIEDCTDTDIDTPTDGQALIYDDTNSKWKNDDLPDDPVTAEKVTNATSGNLAGLNSNGNLTDSNIAASDVVVKSSTAGLLKNDGTVDTT